MGKIKLKKGGLTNFTNISNLFLDEFMPKANGDYVKIYLFLLRYASELESDLSVCKIADIFDYTEKDIIRALRYWEQSGLLTLDFENDKLTGICLNDYAETAVSTVTAPEPKKVSPLTQKKSYTANELEKFLENDEISLLLYMVQKYIGKPLNETEMNTLLFFYDGLGFSLDLIEYLVEYCVGNNHKSMRYIEKVALAWADENIKTITEAKEKTVTKHLSFNRVLSAFGITGRGPGDSERAYIVKWTDAYGFDLDIIIEACNRTIEKIHQPSFEYADSILSKWNSSGVRNLSDIKISDDEWSRHKAKKSKETGKTSGKTNSFTGFNQRNYDYAELEKRLLK